MFYNVQVLIINNNYDILLEYFTQGSMVAKLIFKGQVQDTFQQCRPELCAVIFWTNEI